MAPTPLTDRPTYYGCCKCQAYHDSEEEPALYADHLYFQSKHGWQERELTAAEAAERLRRKGVISE